MDLVVSPKKKKVFSPPITIDFVVVFSEKKKGLQPTNFDEFCGVLQSTNKKTKDSYL